MNFQTIFAKNKIVLIAALFLAAVICAYNTLPFKFWALPQPHESPITNHQSPVTMTFDYDTAWKEIDSLEQNGLPKSALEKTEALLDVARKEANAPQTVKALIYRGKYQSQLEEEGLAMAINRLNEEANKADFPVKPILQSMLAEMYSNYLDQNLWRFQNRTETVDFKPADFKTWSIAQLTEKSAELYQASLTDSRLKTTDIGDFKILLTEGKNDEGLRPTLFDFLAHRAIDYFMNERSYVTQPAYKFYIDDARAFAPAAEFVDWKIEARDSASQKLQTLLLLQDLLRFRLSEKRLKSPSLLDADLKRLAFVHQNAVLEGKDAAYLSALENLKSQFDGTPGVAEVIFQLASYYQQKGAEYQNPPFGAENKDERKDYFKKAQSLCFEAVRSYAGSFGAKQCEVLLKELESASLTMQVEQVNLPNQPFLAKIEYKNTKQAWLKIIRLDEKRVKEIEAVQYEQNAQERTLQLLQSWPSVKTWSANLPDDGDLRQHNTEVKVDALPNGKYAFLLADNQVFKADKTSVSYAIANVSKLGYWERNDNAGTSNLVIFDRETGAPLKGVKVELFYNRYDESARRYRWEKKGGVLESNAEGFVNFPDADERRPQYKVVLCTAKDTLDTGDQFYRYKNYDNRRPYDQTLFFLDRAIYRPGQTVFFKGIALNFDEKRMPKIIKNEKVTVTFLDANYQKVSDLQLRTNEYGTFSGQFTAPHGGLLGQMQIQSSIGGQSQSFRVEEYKRPKFEVSFEPVKGSYRLNEEVAVTGKAIAYAGNNIDGAKVSYRVVREVRFPWMPWWYWRYFPQRGETMEIANGEAITDAEGKFEIKFNAVPDRSVPKEQKPEFSYTVYADVTDITGETQSGETSVNVGFISMRADVTANGSPLGDGGISLDSLRKFDLITNNLSGQFEPAKGALKLELLKAPSQSYQNRYWEKPDRHTMTEAEFKKAFPQFAFGNEDEQQNWPVERSIFSENWDTEKSKEVILPKVKLNAGWYVLTLTTQDKFGEKIELKKYFSAYDLSNKALPAPTESFHLLTGANLKITGAFEPNELAVLWFGTTEKSLNVLLEVNRENNTLLRKWLNVKDLHGEIVSIKEEYRGNLGYSFSYARQNRSHNQQGSINVPWSNKELTIEYGTFRDKLLPGQQEEWVVKIKGPKGDKVAAEMVAGMYDASLDAFAANSWGMNVWPSTWSNIRYGSNSFQAVGGNWLVSPNLPGIEGDYRQYRGLNWFNWYMYDNYGWMGGRAPGVVMSRARMKGEPMEEIVADATTQGAAFTSEQIKSLPTRDVNAMDGLTTGASKGNAAQGGDGDLPKPAKPATDLSQVKVRTNLNETVFFYPHLMTDAEGNVVIKFTMNEALTKWKFLGLAPRPKTCKSARPRRKS
jgi:hypothetical protein